MTQFRPNSSLHLEKQAGTWKWGLLCLALLAPFFFLSYGFANHYAAGLTHVPSIVFAWEQHIPLWAWSIVPYWSIDLFYGLSLLLCANKFELRQHVLRLFSAQLIAVTLFIIFPLKFSWVRPPLEGFFAWCFDVLMGFDQPYNQAPSLHIILLIILWDFFRRHTPRSWYWCIDLWGLLIGISVLTTWQHHFIDVPTGIIVGALCMWLFPLHGLAPYQRQTLQQTTGKHFKIGSYYLIIALLLLGIAISIQSWALWLLYPALSLLLVAFAYYLARPHFFQKQENGQFSIAAWILFAPYLIFAWCNSRIWTRKNPQDSLVFTTANLQVYLGRIPTAQHAQQYHAIFDCCAELPMLKPHLYASHYSLDLMLLTPTQLTQATLSLQQLIEQSIKQHTQLNTTLNHAPHKINILIHCALGYSRSSSILATWLLQQHYAHDVPDAIQMIQHARPWIVLKPLQQQSLLTFFQQHTINPEKQA